MREPAAIRATEKDGQGTFFFKRKIENMRWPGLFVHRTADRWMTSK
jgi:hypothetical protein